MCAQRLVSFVSRVSHWEELLRRTDTQLCAQRLMSIVSRVSPQKLFAMSLQAHQEELQTLLHGTSVSIY